MVDRAHCNLLAAVGRVADLGEGFSAGAVHLQPVLVDNNEDFPGIRLVERGTKRRPLALNSLVT